MRVKVLYRRNLHLTKGHLAAQVAHAVLGMPNVSEYIGVVVLGASDVNFFTAAYKDKCYVVRDKKREGHRLGAETCVAFFDCDKRYCKDCKNIHYCRET